MQLTYRGRQYQFTAAAYSTIDTAITAQYRGGVYQVKRPVQVMNIPSYQLKYRGVAYPQKGIVISGAKGFAHPAIA
ncbi:MAG: hypothetical protein Kow00121_49060 [Elainellaceae cyanobacterium]